MEILLREILAELKAIRIILAPQSTNNTYKLVVIANESEKNTGEN